MFLLSLLCGFANHLQGLHVTLDENGVSETQMLDFGGIKTVQSYLLVVSSKIKYFLDSNMQMVNDFSNVYVTCK